MTNILFVDDDYLTLETYDKIFSLSGFTVLLADSGKKALEITGNQNIDLIILDMRLPLMDGFDLLGLLKSNEATTEIPVIMTSANPKTYQEKALASGAQYYLAKPVFPEHIKEFLENLGSETSST